MLSDAALRVLTLADTAAVQGALALMTGALASGWWLRRARSDWACAVLRLSRRWLVVGTVLALAAESASLWLQAATMIDDPTAEVGPMIALVLRESHFGRAWALGMAALLAALLCTSLTADVMRGIAAGAVAAFAFSRSVVSHAAEQGDLSLQVGVDWLHLLLVCLWVGIVLMGVVVLRRSPHDAAGRTDAVRWISALSETATVALVLIVATGALKVWWATPTLQMLVRSSYGQVLFVKLLLVAAAAALGGYNRFRTMPALLHDLVEPGLSVESLPGRFTSIMKVEAAVLACAVISAAVLSSTATPGEG